MTLHAFHKVGWCWGQLGGSVHILLLNGTEYATMLASLEATFHPIPSAPTELWFINDRLAIVNTVEINHKFLLYTNYSEEKGNYSTVFTLNASDYSCGTALAEFT